MLKLPLLRVFLVSSQTNQILKIVTVSNTGSFGVIYQPILERRSFLVRDDQRPTHSALYYHYHGIFVCHHWQLSLKLVFFLLPVVVDWNTARSKILLWNTRTIFEPMYLCTIYQYNTYKGS